MGILCRLCGSVDTTLLTNKCKGYVEDTFYNIYRCNACTAHFTIEADPNIGLFDDMYLDQNIHAYGRYFGYADEVLRKNDPLAYLASQELPYYAAEQLLSQFPASAKVLDVGCGLGYLTFSIAKRDYDVVGIDVSAKALKFAAEKFGPYYNKADLSDLTEGEKFDVIIALEVIESLQNPIEFIRQAVSFLNPGGKLMITFPNRDFFNKKAIWLTIPPPLNTSWNSLSGIRKILATQKLHYNIPNLSGYRSKTDLLPLRRVQNIFRRELFTDHIVQQNRIITELHQPISGKNLKSIIKQVFDKSGITRICNSMYLHFGFQSPTGIIILHK